MAGEPRYRIEKRGRFTSPGSIESVPILTRDGQEISERDLLCDIANMLDRLTRRAAAEDAALEQAAATLGRLNANMAARMGEDPTNLEDLAPYYAILDKHHTEPLALPPLLVEVIGQVLFFGSIPACWPRPWGMRWREDGACVEITGPWLKEPRRQGDCLAFSEHAFRTVLERVAARLRPSASQEESRG